MALIRLEPHLFTSLPAHPSLPESDSRPQLQPFLQEALCQAIYFLNKVPSRFKSSKQHSSAPSEAKVRLGSWRNDSDAKTSNKILKPEFWVCRRSEHVDATAPGTASWEEFETGLRSNHAEHEMDYTPTVSGVEKLLEWPRSEALEVEESASIKYIFKDVDVEVNLITHSFKPDALIAPRSFISLTISAMYDHMEEITMQGNHNNQNMTGFITVQIPLKSTPTSTPSDLHQRIISAVPKQAIFANYASVERVSLLPPLPSPTDINPDRIHWTMATTSDAGGLIPKWVQRSWILGGVPRAVVDDVGLFIGWTMRRRST
ncbi:uncharacterized protein N7483_003168 [Penicillium malachiteum]|uniref:uncharacterized protein n=1 Tax=Penicillium malachiteum TaxID=1324776 RepID=UPI0025477BB1|nr:uncharacterized protein N7483_003168 [Penicillium malachiteum]KAJ5728660.1 hypothetical protein N7483_003168 [Penicillium malachiteum]